MEEYEFRNVRGHVEVFRDGVFQFSADTRREATEELQEIAISMPDKEVHRG